MRWNAGGVAAIYCSIFDYYSVYLVCSIYCLLIQVAYLGIGGY